MTWRRLTRLVVLIGVLMASNRGLTTLLFSAGGVGPWQHVSANGQILRSISQTPVERTPGCYGMGRLADGTIWIAAETHFHAFDRGLTTRRQGVTVETIAGQSARHLYRIRRGDRLKLPPPQHDFAAVLDEIDPRTWAIGRSWTLPGVYSTYGRGQLAVDPTEAVAYYAKETSSGTIQRHDLTAGAALPDLVARPVSSGGLIVLADGSVVVGYTDRVQRYAADGSHLRTYDAGVIRAGQGLVTHGATGRWFWVQGFADGTPYSTLYEFDVDGHVRHEWNTPANGVRWDAPFVDPPGPGTLLTDLAAAGVDANGQTVAFWQSDGTQLGTIDTVDAANAFFGIALGTGNNFKPFDQGAIAVDAPSDRIYINLRNGAKSGGWGGPSHPDGSTAIAVCDGNGTPVAFIFPGDHDATIGGGYSLLVPFPGKLWVAIEGSSNGEVWEYDSAGAFIRVVATFGTASDPAIEAAYGMAKVGDFLYFTALVSGVDYGLYKYDLVNGGLPVVVISTGSVRLDLPVQFTMTAANEILLTAAGDDTTPANSNKVTRYDLAGALLDTYAVPGVSPNVHGLAVDPDGLHFYAGDYPHNLIYRFLIADSSAPPTSFSATAGDGDDCASALTAPTGASTMACPDPCDKAGHDVPYYALSAEGNTTLFYDRAMQLAAIEGTPAQVSTPNCVAIAPAGGKVWIAMDNEPGGNSILYLVDPSTIDENTGECLIERTITTEAGIVIGELGGRRALWPLDCDRLLTVDRATHELIELCLPAEPDEDDEDEEEIPQVALVSKRYSLIVNPLDGVLVDGGKNLLYIDGADAKVWNLKNDALLRTVGTVNGIWPTLLTDNTFLVYSGGDFRAAGATNEFLRYTRNGKLVRRYPIEIPSILSAGLYGFVADIQTDVCSCGNKKDGVIWAAGEEDPAAIPVTLLDAEQGAYVYLGDIVQGGLDVAAAFTVLAPADGGSFNDQTAGGGGTRRQPNRHCGDEGALSTVSPNPGCNKGGKGWTPSYTGPSGTVPECADPVGEETLTGKSSVFVDVAIRHTSYPALTVETLRYALVELDDAERKEGRIQSIGDVEHGLSDAQGNMESASVNISIMDADGRPIGSRMVDAHAQFFARDEVSVQARSAEGRIPRGSPLAPATPRMIGRGLLYGESYGTPIVAQLTAVDPLFIDGGSFSPDKKVPQYTFPLAYYTDAPKDMAQLPMAVIIGEESDEGAVHPVTGLPAARGKCPIRYVGIDNLGTGPGGEPWGRFNVCLFAIYKILSLYGSDLGAMGLYGRAAVVSVVESFEDDEDTTGTETTVVALDGLPDLSAVPTDESAQIVIFTESGRTEAPITAVDNFAKRVTVNTSLDPTIAQGVSWYISSIDYVPKRVKIDLDTRNGVDAMVPKWAGYIRSTVYEDFTSTDFDARVTDCWVRGPLLAAHLAGEVTLAVNAIGIEDVGDGSGLPIVDYFTAYNFFWDNLVHRQLAAPLAGAWPATNGEVPVWSDGYSKTKQSSFAAAQAQTVAELGGYGLRVNAYFNEGIPIRDAIQLWNDNGGCRTYVDEYGRVGVWRLDPFASTAAWPRVEHVSRVFGDVRRVRALDEAMNVVKGGCDWDPDGQAFREDDKSATSTAAITRNGGIKRYSKHLDGKLVANATHFQHLLDRILALQQDGPIYVTIEDGDIGLLDYPVGSGILFTSVMGPGPNGYVDQPLIILRRTFHVDSHLVSLVCLDVGAMLIAENRHFISTDDDAMAPISTDDDALAPVAA